MNRSTILFRDGLVFLAVVGAIFLGAVLREVNLLLFFASVLACFLFLDFRLGRKTIGGIKIRGTPPAIIHAGDAFIMTVRLENVKKKQASWGVLFEDRVTPLTGWRAVHQEEQELKIKQSPGYRPVCYFEKIDPGQEVRKTYAGQLPLRGRYQLGPTSVSTRFPLGFFRSSHYYRETAEIIVFPKLGILSRRWLDDYNQATDQQNRFRLHPSRSSDELMGIRRWQTGDVRKWIHWRATARHNQILVRQFQDRRHQDIAIVLDTWMPGTMNRTAFENLELAISFSATITREFTKSISGYLFFASGTRNNVFRGKTGMTIYHAVMEELAVLQPSKEDILSDVLQNLFDSIGSQTNIIVVTREALDPFSSKRLDTLHSNPGLQRYLSRINVVNVSDPAFDTIFHF